MSPSSASCFWNSSFWKIKKNKKLYKRCLQRKIYRPLNFLSSVILRERERERAWQEEGRGGEYKKKTKQTLIIENNKRTQIKTTEDDTAFKFLKKLIGKQKAGKEEAISIQLTDTADHSKCKMIKS